MRYRRARLGRVEGLASTRSGDAAAAQEEFYNFERQCGRYPVVAGLLL